MIHREAWYQEADDVDMEKAFRVRQVLNRLGDLDFDGLYSYVGVYEPSIPSPRAKELRQLLYSFFKEQAIFPYRHVAYRTRGWTKGEVSPEEVEALDHVLDLWEKFYRPMYQEYMELMGISRKYIGPINQAYQVYYDLEWGLEIMDPGESPNLEKWAKETMEFIKGFVEAPDDRKAGEWAERLQTWRQVWEPFYRELEQDATFTVPQ